jgi:cytochrome c oxidase subunit 2
MITSLLLLAAGCSGTQSALDTHGASASAVRDLIVAIVVTCTIVWLAVVGVMTWSLIRRNSRSNVGEVLSERRTSIIIGIAVAATVLIISAFTIASFYVTRSDGNGGRPEIIVRVKAQQWWWQFIYEYPDGTQIFQTANEMHIPVDHDIQVKLESVDVIHSFWVPSLAGKLDMIPGRLNILTLHAQTVGIFRGQCAEFCGLQHSHMSFQIVAQNDEDYRAWEATQQRPALNPTEPEAALGKFVFLRKPCAACHTIRGTTAIGTSGPDLTHVGSRTTIASGLVERTRGSLAAWIADPQTLKPGNNMPLVPLTSDELRQISAYLEALK